LHKASKAENRQPETATPATLLRGIAPHGRAL
jgi:hypothetical protein